ncbi:MAG: N-acyl homoserine lactonase family protein, partial [Pseudomonadota bacterium]
DKPFPIVVDVENMLTGFKKIRALASEPGLLIPGHDPLVRELFEQVSDGVHRLDRGPLRPLVV